MTIQKAIEITRKILNQNGLTNWGVTINRRKHAFGVCNYSKKQIELSSILIPNCTDKSIMDTIYHEVAHALTPGHHHNMIWRMKCINLGGNGLRCGGNENYKDGNADFLNNISKYNLVCPVCGYTVARNRKPNRAISCGKHGRKFDVTYQFKVIQNY